MIMDERFEDWQGFLDNASVGIHLVDGTGKILWANKPELSLLGYESGEYFDRHIADFHIDKDVIEQILEILGGGKMLQAYPARLRAKDGTVKHVLINSNVYAKDGEFAHTRCFTCGISEAVYNQLRRELPQSPHGG
jgi:PAS domain S-box-containing protein